MLKLAKMAGAALIAALVLGVFAGCGSQASYSEASKSSAGSSAGKLVVGSQDFYENEIIAEIYAQALEAKGYTVERSFRIGQREVYMPEIEAGKIDVFPEYTGNLLQYYNESSTATESKEVYDALVKALPSGLHALDQAEAADADSYVVTKDFADKHNVSSIADLAGVGGVVLAGNSELQTRPYGPKGLASVYGVTVSQFKPVEDSGGPLTVKALTDGAADVVDLYSSTPDLARGDLVVLKDPKNLFLASHVVPVASNAVDAKAAEAINAVQAALTSDELIAMNAESVNDQRSAAAIASSFLERHKLK